MSPEIHYEIIIYWSRDDATFIAEVPELPGCAADGATYGEALANVEVVIRQWIETARELGRPIPEPRGRLMFARAWRGVGNDRPRPSVTASHPSPAATTAAGP